MDADLVRQVLAAERRLERLEAQESGRFVPLTTPLTSTSWDGDAYSTVGSSTLLDLSAVFGAPAGVRAVLLRVVVRDSAVWGTDDLWFAGGPSATYFYQVAVRAFGGDVRNEMTAVCNCNANGDIYYRINASGSGTLDVWIQVWGYWV